MIVELYWKYLALETPVKHCEKHSGRNIAIAKDQFTDIFSVKHIRLSVRRFLKLLKLPSTLTYVTGANMILCLWRKDHLLQKESFGRFCSLKRESLRNFNSWCPMFFDKINSSLSLHCSWWILGTTSSTVMTASARHISSSEKLDGFNQLGKVGSDAENLAFNFHLF